MAFRKFDPGDVFFIPQMVMVTDNRWHGMDISPDGTQIVFKWPITGAFELYVVPFAGGEPRKITTTPKNSQCVHPRWSPKGDLIAFLRDQGGDRRFHIWVVDPKTATERQVSKEPAVGADSRFEWSPDGTRVAYRPVDNGQGIWTMDVNTGATRMVVPAASAGGVAGNGVIPDWSHDGRFITYQSGVSVAEGSAAIRANVNDLVHVVPSDGSAAPWTIETHQGNAHALFPRWSANDDFIAFTTDARGRSEVAIVPVKDGRKAGDVRYVTSSTYDEYLLGWGQTGSILYRRAIEGTVLPHRVNLATGVDEELASGTGVCYAFREAKDGTVAYQWSTPLSPPDLYVKPNGKPARQITHSLPKDFDPDWLVMPEHVWYPSLDGTKVPAVLWRPKPEAVESEHGKPPPALIMAHGGGPSQHFLLWEPIAQWFANCGYVVLQVNGRGSKGYGPAFRSANMWVDPTTSPGGIRPPGKGIEDHIAGANWMEKEGIADGERICIYGPSAGALITLESLAAAPTRFAAGCPARGPVKFVIPYISHISVPMLVLAGKNDPMVPSDEVEMFVDELKRQGKTYDAHIYPDEGHGYRNPANVRDAYTRMETFFDKHVKHRKVATPA